MQTMHPTTALPDARRKPQTKFVIGGVLFAAALVLLMATAFTSTAQYFYTVNELLAHRAELGTRSVRATGAVVGDTITINPETLEIRFEMAHLPDERELTDLAAALHSAVVDPNGARVTVVYVGPKPDLLKNEAQAIVSGRFEADGVFYADELLLKCPSHYEEAAAGTPAPHTLAGAATPAP